MATGRRAAGGRATDLEGESESREHGEGSSVDCF